MEDAQDKDMLENSLKGPDNVKLLKKRKRKPKNKYKELNLQQRRAAGIIDDVSSTSKNHESQTDTKTPEVKNDNKKVATPAKLGEGVKKRNKKRKLSEHQKSADEEHIPCKKGKPSEGKIDSNSKKKNVSKLSKVLVELQPPSESAHVPSKFNYKKLKVVLEKNIEKNVNQNTTTLTTEVNEGKSLPIKKKKLKKESPVKAKSLRERVMEKLASARFRYINENLYNMTSSEAVNMFKEDREAFKVYHEGYSAQVDKWPVNPVDMMIEYIDSKEGNLVVADFGCGEAKIAQSVQGKTVHSFDLVALNEHVTVCDISKVPLPNKSVNIVVFCLSLMGTNLINYLCEASRVLKDNGTLLVAEVLSRFEKVGEFVRKMNKLGFTIIKRDESNKMFVWFEFQKAKKPPSKDKMPKIELAACVYKKR